MNNPAHLTPRFNGPLGQEDMPYLLTPGPLTTSRSVKQAMLADYGSRDAEFRTIVADIRRELLRLAGCDGSYECVIVQGSGTFAMEAALGSLCPAKRKKTLVIANGNYGDRAAHILETLGRPMVKVDRGDSQPPREKDLVHALDTETDISHVWLVHCETTSGIVNPIQDLAKIAKERKKIVMLDAMSSFGALPLDMVADNIDVMVSSSNKCIEGVPGFSYVILKKELLLAAEGKCHSVVLDLFTQWKGLEANGQFRFTPPTHSIVAFRQALRELEAEGGISMRLQRYHANATELISRMRAMGFKPLLKDEDAGPIIQTFLTPRDPKFDFEHFYESLRARGFAIYPGKLTKRPSFRIGTIGQLDLKTIRAFARVVEEVLKEMDVREFNPVDA